MEISKQHDMMRMTRLAVLLCLGWSLSGCYIFNFFQRDTSAGEDADDSLTGTVVGESLGSKASDIDDSLVAAVHAVGSTRPPAVIRPDPDLMVRRLLRQYRSEGAVVARQIGHVEQYRLLLGGATEDFSKTPQETYDATSLLAVLKVAEEVCRSLVAPNQWEHEGWTTILPYPVDDEASNITWLIQRIAGLPTARIDAERVTALQAIMDAEEPFITENWWAYQNAYVKYIPVCAAIALDAEALLL